MRMAVFLAFGIVVAALAIAPAHAEGDANASKQAPASRQERLTSAQSYLPMPTLQASRLQRLSPNTAMMVVDMGIDVQNADLRRRADLNAPRLHDALRTALSTYTNVYYRDRTEPDPATLTRLLQQAVDRTLGQPGAQVLLVNIIYQRGAPAP